MKSINKLGLLFLIAATTLCSCNDYLDEQPRKGNGVELETVEQLEAILSGRVDERVLFADWNSSRRYMSDCYSLPEDGTNVDGFITAEDYDAFAFNCFQPKYTEEVTIATAWSSRYKSIFIANTIFDYIDKVTGGTEAQRQELLRKAHFIRAYNYYELANAYCVPYCKANLNELGLPLVTKTAYGNYTRATLEETYALIEDDMEQALGITTPLMENGERKVWRENSTAAHGFAARFYLNKGDYTKAKEYAEKALADNSDITNYNNEGEVYMTEAMDYGLGMMWPAASWYNDVQYDETGLFPSLKQKSYYYHLCYSGSWAVPSHKFLDSFNQEYDMRYKLFFYPEYGALSMGAIGFFYGFSGIAAYSYFYGDAIDAGPCAAEMYMIKAECMARQGQWSEALNELNTKFRPYRISTDAPASVMNLSASNQQEAVNLILKERMLEFPFTMRWMDIRRCNFNEDASDDVTITRRYYPLASGTYAIPEVDKEMVEYTLTPQSDKYTYTMAIPATEMKTSNGTIQQNPYK